MSSGDIRLGQSVLLDGGSAAPRPEIRHCTVETDTFAAGFHAVIWALQPVPNDIPPFAGLLSCCSRRLLPRPRARLFARGFAPLD